MKSIAKRMTAIVLTLIIVLSFSILSSAVTIFEQDGYYYARTSSTTASIYGRYTDESDVIISKNFLEYYVSEIVDSAFIDDENIGTVDFSRAILLQRIGMYAFKNCSSLSGTLILSGRINSIGDSAFEGCSSLEGVSIISPNVRKIPDQCFYNCLSLNQVKLNDKIESIGKLAFANCTNLTEIEIPASVVSISTTAFEGDQDLTLKCFYGSYAHEYAEENGIDYEIIDSWNIPTEPPTEPETDEPTESETVPETEPETEPETYAPITSYLIGDADGDGSISVLDATTIQKCLALLIEDTDGLIHLAGSVDGEKLNVLHATYIQKYLAKIDIDAPIGDLVTIES